MGRFCSYAIPAKNVFQLPQLSFVVVSTDRQTQTTCQNDFFGLSNPQNVIHQNLEVGLFGPMQYFILRMVEKVISIRVQSIRDYESGINP